MTEQQWKLRAFLLLKDTMGDHRDIHSGGYNECELPEGQCLWCSEAQELITAYEGDNKERMK